MRRPFLVAVVGVLIGAVAAAAASHELGVFVAGAEDAPFTLMFVCGQHARERITRDLCATWRADFEAAAEADTLPHLRVVIVENANPEGAELVDAEPCWRGNARSVDLNRNWPEVVPCSRDADTDDSDAMLPEPFELTHGTAPFSEWETRALNATLTAYTPDALVVVHSGAWAFLTPYDACDQSPENYVDLVRVARWMRRHVAACDGRCRVGQSSRELYHSRGTLADYAYHTLRVPMVYTLEVYEGSVDDGGAAALSSRTCSTFFNPLMREEFLTRWRPLAAAFIHIDTENYATLLRIAGSFVTTTDDDGATLPSLSVPRRTTN